MRMESPPQGFVNWLECSQQESLKQNKLRSQMWISSSSCVILYAMHICISEVVNRILYRVMSRSGRRHEISWMRPSRADADTSPPLISSNRRRTRRTNRTNAPNDQAANQTQNSNRNAKPICRTEHTFYIERNI